MGAALEKVDPMSAKKTGNSFAHETTGFGVPKTISPHHFRVEIPRSTSQPVVITEDLGVSENDWERQYLDRVIVPRRNWTKIQTPVKRTFNERLKKNNLRAGQWNVGQVGVDRMLGKELCVLAWAIEDLEDPERVPYAVRNWLGLRPEERWWLFDMVAATTGRPEGHGKGWRKALYFALCDSPEMSVQAVRFGGGGSASAKGQISDMFSNNKD